MGPNDIRERITAQFSGAGVRADIWRGFDLFLDTDAFLNLGYSPWYLPHFVGSSQGRLAGQVGDRLESHLSETSGLPLLDVGCGRGGPAIHLSEEFGFDVTGIDLVPYNVRRARANARKRESTAEFVVGDATALPVAAEAMTACTAIDSLVYVPERSKAISEIARTVARSGIVVITDLVTDSGLDPGQRRKVCAFADAWDMPVPWSVEKYRAALTEAGLDLRYTEDITAHSVGRFRKWTTLFLGLLDSPLQSLVNRLLRSRGLDPVRIRAQVRRAHDALPYLGHVALITH